MDMNRIVISDAGVYVGDTLYAGRSIDSIISAIKLERCAPFGKVFYQISEKTVQMMVASSLCWKCAMCPIVEVFDDGSVYGYICRVEDFNSTEEFIADCNNVIDRMYRIMNSVKYRTLAHITGRWLTLATRNGWLREANGIAVHTNIDADTLGIYVQDCAGGSIYENLSSEEVSFGVIDLVCKPDSIDIETYIQLSDELYKKGCTIYSILVSEDVNELYVVGKCNEKRMCMILEEVTMYKSYSKNVGYIGYSEYHNTDMLTAIDFNDIK